MIDSYEPKALNLSFSVFQENICAQYCWVIYQMVGMFGSGKVERIWQIVRDLPNLNQPNFCLLSISLWPISRVNY